MLTIIIVSCNSKTESTDSKEDISKWQIYVSPIKHHMPDGLSTYEVYRCQHCNSEESMDQVVEKEIDKLVIRIDSLWSSQKKTALRQLPLLQSKLDGLRYEQALINQAIADFKKSEY